MKDDRTKELDMGKKVDERNASHVRVRGEEADQRECVGPTRVWWPSGP